jgi:NDP-sugar pyrophosphorylase family protein
MGDDLYLEKDINKMLENGQGILVKKQKKFIENGIVKSQDGFLQNFSDKSKLENTGLYLLNKNYFKLKPHKTFTKGEFSIPHTLVYNSKKYPIKVIEAIFWQKMNAPKDLLQNKIQSILIDSISTLEKDIKLKPNYL